MSAVAPARGAVAGMSAADDHLRDLLAHRATRSPHHGRLSPPDYPSPTSDYNHTPFSADHPVQDSDTASPFFRSSYASAYTTSSPRSYATNAEDLAISMLDLGDDPRASYLSSADRDTISSFPDTTLPTVQDDSDNDTDESEQ